MNNYKLIYIILLKASCMFLSIIIIILEILDIKIISKLSSSFYSFKKRVDNIYEIEYISEILLKEIKFFNYSFIALYTNITSNFISFLIGLIDVIKLLIIRKSPNNLSNPLKSDI